MMDYKHIKNNRALVFSIGSTIAMVIYVKYVVGHFSNCFTLDAGANSLGLSFYYTLEMVQDFFEARTQEQLICYGQFIRAWDTVFACVYTLMYTSWITYFFKNRRLFLIIPILAMIADWSENYAESLMLETYMNSGFISEALISWGSGINMFKWSMATLTYMLVLVGIMRTVKLFLIKPKLN